MGSPNFSVDSHLHVTYAITSDEANIDDDLIDSIKRHIESENQSLKKGSLKLVNGHHDGVCIHTELNIGGKYEYNGSVPESLDNIAKDMVEASRSAVQYIESKIEDDEGLNFSEFLKSVINEINVGKDQCSLAALLDVDKAVAYILEKNETLDYDTSDEEGREDLVTHVLDWAYWSQNCEAQFDLLITKMQASARKVATAHSMLELSTFYNGWGSSLSPISTELTGAHS